MCLLGFPGIVVDRNSLGGEKNDLTHPAGVQHRPVAVAAINSYCKAKQLDVAASRPFIAELV